MQQQFLNHIERHNLCKTTDKILLAVSGGRDSMVMLDLFIKAGFRIGVAHCNFQLRGVESEGDEEFVKEQCERLGVPVHIRQFETAAFAERERVSTQMAARQLRYTFFEEVRGSNDYVAISTAHHLNDSLETVLLNLTRGTGVEGITGISERTNHIIRPMLFAGDEMIRQYAEENNITWREDSSNVTDNYVRNYIRHHVVTALKHLNPGLENTFADTIERIKGAADFSSQWIEKFKDEHIEIDNAGWKISRQKIFLQPYRDVLLWELIKSLGFNFSQCCEVFREHIPGKRFHSLSHELVVDRDTIFIHPKKKENFTDLVIENNDSIAVNENESISLEKLSGQVSISKDPEHAFFDLDKISWPLRWRCWRNGDAFVPFGMRGEKKISDYLIDMKIPLHLKGRVTVLESGGKIIWVVGFRTHDDYKVTVDTKRILHLRRNENR